ncbi:tyrosine-type recombinase/integrase [Owenweeksia hongkongensis]|uniref:tyrosine-type recombinase/integrase n=1 Tax=Owenweeksia hongkongensis TaxID=253245 RepID=UPI003A90A24F
MPLTELAIKSLNSKPKLYRVADGHGLCVEVTPAGGKHWRWRYRYNGNAQMMALGSYPKVSLKEARKLRSEQQELLDSGKHPAREKKAEKLRHEFEEGHTFQKVALRWLSTREGKLNPKYHLQCHTRLETHVFPYIGNTPIQHINVPDVVSIMERISSDGQIETAKRMKQMISQVFRYAVQRGLCESNPAKDIREILPAKKEKHHACIPPEELPDLLMAIDNYHGNEVVKYGLQLLALTFVRTRELIEAKWEEVDWENKEWHIPKERMKMRRPHMVPLSKQSILILRELQKITGDKEFIFYSPRSKSKHISNGSFLMALRHMGYGKRMTGHGFRSMASTILNEKGFDSEVIERQLAHQDSDRVRSAYNRAEYVAKRRDMMEAYSKKLNL